MKPIRTKKQDTSATPAPAIVAEPSPNPIPLRQPSAAELNLKLLLAKDARSGAHAFSIAEAIGIYPA